MSRSLRALILVMIVGSCGGGYNTPPKNLDDACSIVKQRQSYLTAFKATRSRKPPKDASTARTTRPEATIQRPRARGPRPGSC